MSNLRRHIFKHITLIKRIFCKGRFLNLVLIVIYFLLRKSKPSTLPFILQIEPTNRCNLKCALCLVGRGELKRDKGDMDFHSFKRIIEQFEDKLIYLALFNLGEPLLNKEIYKMIEYASKKRIYSRLSTNADFHKNDLKNLAHSGVDELVISLDCASPQTYFKYKSKDNFEKIINNVEFLIKERARALRPFINLQLLVMKDTENEIYAFKKLVQRLNVDRGLVKTVRVNFPGMRSYSAFLPSNKKYLRAFYHNGYKRKGCYRPWISSVVLWDGSVVPCCFDMEGEYSFGNILHADFGWIWHNNKYSLFRENILKSGSRNSICNECSISGFWRDLTVFF